jgi:hypothetical protein
MNASASYGLSNNAMMRVPSETATQPTGDGSGQPSQSPCFSNLGLPLAFSPAGSSGLALDKDAIDGALGEHVGTCNRVIRYTFLRSTPPTSPGHGVVARELSRFPQPAARNSRAFYFCPGTALWGAPYAAGDLGGVDRFLGHRPAVRLGGHRSHAPNIGESDVYEIVEKRQRSG